jgi:hypothetical protein
MLVMPAATFVLLAIVLIWSVIRLVKSNQEDVLASSPMAQVQELNLSSSGVVVLLLEVPRLASDFRSFQIELTEKQTGQIVTMKYSLITAKGAVYGLSTMQVPFGRWTARAGAYVCRIDGLLPGKDYSRYQLILSRPYIGRMTLQIIAIVFCGVGMLLSILWAAWLEGLLKPG